jgi:hypothetical protein
MELCDAAEVEPSEPVPNAGLALSLTLAGLWPVLGQHTTVIPAVPPFRPSILSPFVYMHITEVSTLSFRSLWLSSTPRRFRNQKKLPSPTARKAFFGILYFLDFLREKQHFRDLDNKYNISYSIYILKIPLILLNIR